MTQTRKTVDIDHTGEGGPVRVAVTCEDRAKRAAQILARRMFGPRGTVATLRLDSWAPDGSSHTYEAFLGSHTRGGGVTGRNVWIYA